MFSQIPEISVQALAEKLATNENFTILDVRETWEIKLAHLADERTVILPLSQISRSRKEAFPPALLNPQAEIIVMCHHGVRSADVTNWMRSQGWQNVFSLAGGIAAYANEIDPSVGVY